jgi:biotin carboxylase
MKILVLGGSNSQINAVLRAKQLGYYVIVSDYYENSPGKLFSDHSEMTSTFDIEGNIEIARNKRIDGVMTMGTDQPVYTVAMVAQALNLPSFLDTDTAKAVTNKKIMNQLFTACGIPTVKYKIIREDFTEDELDGIRLPVVVKPLDSQGQRGVYRLGSIDEIKKSFNEVLSYSREKEIIVEEYYENQEVTVSGWVLDGETHVLTVTDRVTYDNYPHIGICTAHNFPSVHYESHYDEIYNITKNIVKGFRIKNGPIYFQMFIGNTGIRVNEVACRIGGAYEDEFIPLLTGVDILGMVLNYSLGRQVDYTNLKNYDIRKNSKCASVQLLFVGPGIVKSMTDLEEIKSLPGVVEAKYNIEVGANMGQIINATQRAGYVIIEGSNQENLRKNITTTFHRLKIYDGKGHNMVKQF